MKHEQMIYDYLRKLGIISKKVKSEFEANKMIAEMHLQGYRMLSFVGNGDKSFNLTFTSKDIRYED